MDAAPAPGLWQRQTGTAAERNTIATPGLWSTSVTPAVGVRATPAPGLWQKTTTAAADLSATSPPGLWRKKSMSADKSNMGPISLISRRTATVTALRATRSPRARGAVAKAAELHDGRAPSLWRWLPKAPKFDGGPFPDLWRKIRTTAQPSVLPLPDPLCEITAATCSSVINPPMNDIMAPPWSKVKAIPWTDTKVYPWSDTKATQWTTSIEDELVKHCSRDNPNRTIVEELQMGCSIIRISEDAVVKCGWGITEAEVSNQRMAYEIMGPLAIVRVPRVYHHFTRIDRCFNMGYLVMEYINGQPISAAIDPDKYLAPVARVLEQFEQVRREKPGALGDGLPAGRMWLDNCPATLDTISDLEEYYNTKQLKLMEHLNLAGMPLVFCHLDIAPRNILVLEDGSLALVDWSSGGFYPRLFERANIRLNIRKENDWNTKLLALLNELDDIEKPQVTLLERAHFLGIKYI